MTWEPVQGAIDVEEGLPQHPLPPTLLSLAEANMFTNLHTLRIRYPMSWLQDSQLLAEIVPRCTRLEHLYLGHVKYNDSVEHLRALVVPSLVSLHLNLRGICANRLPLEGDTLPLSACPKLRTLSLAGIVERFGYSGPLFTNESTPPDLRALRISIPDGALDHFAPEFPTLETLYLCVLKTTGGVMLTCTGLPKLQHLHIEGNCTDFTAPISLPEPRRALCPSALSTRQTRGLE